MKSNKKDNYLWHQLQKLIKCVYEVGWERKLAKFFAESSEAPAITDAGSLAPACCRMAPAILTVAKYDHKIFKTA